MYLLTRFIIFVTITEYFTYINTVENTKPSGGFLLLDIPEDASLLVPQLVEKHGYPCETHTVTTSDGYILNMHRIHKNSNRRIKAVAFLQHGILGSSADWLLTSKSLGYVLADDGFDVWMGNARGNRYSSRHVRLRSTNSKFWDFSWHHIGIHDLPAMIDFVLQATNQSSLFYIGHSQGTTTFYVMCSEKLEYNSKIKLHISLSAVAYLKYSTSIFIKIFKFVEAAVTALDWNFGVLERSQFQSILGQIFCSDHTVTQFLCVKLLATMGFNPKQLNKTMLPILSGHIPAGASLKQFLHFIQLNKSGKFRQYDYGPVKNVELYKSTIPPDYDIEKITSPVYIYYSKNDLLSHEYDVNKLAQRLQNLKDKILIPDSEFNHMDYLHSINAYECLYRPLLNNMHSFL